MTRLSLETLGRLPADCARPAYDVGAVRVGIVHLGIGAFHRAHQAVYLDDRLAAGEMGWGICGASLRSPETADALVPQDGLYTLAIRSGEGEHLRVFADAVGPSADRLAPALFGLREVFADDLPGDPRFTRPVRDALDGLFRKGARAVVESLVGEGG